MPRCTFCAGSTESGIPRNPRVVNHLSTRLLTVMKEQADWGDERGDRGLPRGQPFPHALHATGVAPPPASTAITRHTRIRSVRQAVALPDVPHAKRKKSLFHAKHLPF